MPTPDGPVTVKVKPGTEDGKLLRVKGKGAPKLKGSGTGDLLARVKLTVPKKLSKQEREAIEALREASAMRVGLVSFLSGLALYLVAGISQLSYEQPRPGWINPLWLVATLLVVARPARDGQHRRTRPPGAK